MKTRITLFAFLISLSCFSQKDSNETKQLEISKLNNGAIYINAGIGYSLHESFINGQVPLLTFLYTNGEPLITSASPVYSFSVNYYLTPSEIIGLSSSYQKWTGTYINQGSLYVYNIPENQTRLNLGLCWLHNIIIDKQTDLFFGARIGLSYWQTTQYNPAIPPYSSYISKIDAVYPSIQTLIGLRKYFSKTIGLNLEAGIGTPYLAEIGLFYKFLKK